MEQIVVSKDGKLACGGSFASSQGSCVPGSIKLLKGSSGTDVISPDLVAFSAFGVARSTRLGVDTVHSAGEHVALAYNDADSFFSAVIVRCDTWAVQWGIERSACLADAQITHLASLCANSVCGVATPKSAVAQPAKQCVFIATRFDVAATSRKENKEWRQFLAAPRAIVTGLESEGIACVAACDKNSFLLLTLAGSLALVRLNINEIKSKQKSDSSFFSVRLMSKNLRAVEGQSRMAVHADESDRVYAAVYTRGGNTVQLVQLGGSGGDVDSTTELSPVTEITTGVPADTVSFVGPFHLCVYANRAQQNVQFFGLVPGSASTEAMTFEPLTASHVPLAVFYNDAAERVVFFSSSMESSKFTAAADEQRLSSLIETSVSFTTGPFGQNSLDAASWTSVANPYRHHGPQTRHFAEDDSRQEEDGDVRVLKDATANTNGKWTPLTLCYALAADNTSHKTDVAVFSVETAPFLHTRLIKQWHNATAGLKMILGAVSTRSYGAVTLPWNPRHVRRALRLLSQVELSSLLHSIATAISASERVSSSVSYYNATTAAVEVALHVISLARQMGAILQPDDVKAVTMMLRACRECGHELLRYASRMELLMESCLQQRAMNRVLRRRTASPSAGDDASAKDLEKNFYGISAELQTERTLHTRYTSNTWAQHLAAHESSYKSAANEAVRFLAVVKRGNESAGDRALSDWRRLGAEAHQDPILNEFEQTLL